MINDSVKKKERQLQLVTPVFVEFNLQSSDTKTEHTVLKRGEKKNEEWCSTKMLGSLMGDREDMVHRKQSYIT